MGNAAIYLLFRFRFTEFVVHLEQCTGHSASDALHQMCISWLYATEHAFDCLYTASEKYVNLLVPLWRNEEQIQRHWMVLFPHTTWIDGLLYVTKPNETTKNQSKASGGSSLVVCDSLSFTISPFIQLAFFWVFFVILLVFGSILLVNCSFDVISYLKMWNNREVAQNGCIEIKFSCHIMHDVAGFAIWTSKNSEHYRNFTLIVRFMTREMNKLKKTYRLTLLIRIKTSLWCHTINFKRIRLESIQYTTLKQRKLYNRYQFQF